MRVFPRVLYHYVDRIRFNLYCKSYKKRGCFGISRQFSDIAFEGDGFSITIIEIELIVVEKLSLFVFSTKQPYFILIPRVFYIYV